VLSAAGVGLMASGVVACSDGGGSRAARVDVSAPVTVECPDADVPSGMERLPVLAEDGTPIGAATVGSGSTAVVLAHGSGQDLCDWLPFVPRLVDMGLTAIPYDLRGRGSSGGAKGAVEPLPSDLAAVVDAARQRGAEKVVLVGTSLGAATALVAADRIHPPVEAVVALTPPRRLGDLDVGREAAGFGGPVHLLVAEGDDGFPGVARDLAAAIPTALDPVIVGGKAHGMGLVEDRPEDVAAAIARAAQVAGGP
jgi:pimeloyl-ACP methyl ester carboxylesterase